MGHFRSFTARMAGKCFRSFMAPADGCFRSFRNFKPKFLQRAFARFRARFRAHTKTNAARARFGAYFRSICVSEAEAWTYESSDCFLHPHGTIGSPVSAIDPTFVTTMCRTECYVPKTCDMRTHRDFFRPRKFDLQMSF